MRSGLLGLCFMACVCGAGETPRPALNGNLSPEKTLPLADERDAYEPAAAWGQGVFLVVWKSGLMGKGDLRKGISYIGDLAGCLVDDRGNALSKKPFTVSSAPDLQERPRMAFGKGVFLVVWQDFRNGKDWDVYAARVKPDGTVLDPKGIAVGSESHNQALPDVTWDGNAFQVVWQDFRSGGQYEVYGARVNPDGAVLDSNGIALVAAKHKIKNHPVCRYNPVVAGDVASGKSLLFWRGTYIMKPTFPKAGCHLMKNGTVVGEATFVEGDHKKTPASDSQTNFPMCLAAGGAHYLGAWSTNTPAGRGNSANDAHAALFTKEGKLKKRFYLTVDPKQKGTVTQNRIRNPRAVWNGTGFVVAWDQWEGKKKIKDKTIRWPVEKVFASTVSTSGAVSEALHIAGENRQPAIRPCVASNGSGVSLIAYEKHPKTADVPIHIGYRILKDGKR